MGIGLEREDGEDEVAIDIQASHRHWGLEEGKRRWAKGPGNKKLLEIVVGGCSRGEWRLRSVERSGGTCWPRHCVCRTAAPAMWLGTLRGGTWTNSTVREYLASWCGTTR